MTEGVNSPKRDGRAVRRRIRRVVGAALLVATGVVAVLFVLGSWNPWQLVALEYRFGNPAVGFLLVSAGLLVGWWLAFPVVSDVRHAGRLAWRLGLSAATLLSLACWGMFGAHFSLTVDEVVHADSGDRALALVTDRAKQPNTYLRVWSGSGLGTREVGELGEICGSVSMRFLTADRIELETAYGTWQIDLDPDTGAPRQVLGPACGDGPVPVGG